MINAALFRQSMKSGLKLLLLFALILTVYVSVMVTMFDPEIGKALEAFAKLCPRLWRWLAWIRRLPPHRVSFQLSLRLYHAGVSHGVWDAAFQPADGPAGEPWFDGLCLLPPIPGGGWLSLNCWC